MLLWLALACGPDIRAMYEDQRVAALTVATEKPSTWEPDLVLQIAGPDFSQAVGDAIRVALTRDVPVLKIPLALGMEAKLEPSIGVEEAALHPSDSCASCLAFDAVLTGRAKWTLGPASGTIPLDVGAKGVFSLEIVDGHIIEAMPRAVSQVRVRITDLAGLSVNPSREIQEWLTGQLSSRVPHIKVVELDTSTLPLRDLRLRSSPGVVRVEALTNVPGSLPVGALPVPEHGVELAISETALIGLVRRAAFEKGELTMDVYADPLALEVNGGEFALDLRLWRLVGRGWWRDYRVYGRLAVEDRQVKLVPSRTEPLGASPGAGLVDPLAALFEGKILETITSSVAQSLPATQRQDLGMVRLRADTSAVTGAADALVVDGTLTVKRPAGDDR
jgi:hypothetical protein